MKNAPHLKFSKILVIRRDNIGDLLCTTPLLAALRRHYPQAHIAVLANAYNGPILNNNPDVDRVYTYTKAKHSDENRLVAWWRQWRLYRNLKQAGFDLIINANPTAHERTGRLVRYLGAPVRLGVDRESGCYNLVVADDNIPAAHHVRQVFALLAPLGISGEPGPMQLRPRGRYEPPMGARRARIGVHLSSRKPCNRWPLASYVDALQDLLSQDFEVVVFWAPGSQHNKHHPGDDELAEVLVGRFGASIRAVPTTSLGELVEQVNQVDVMVCPDGGTLHIAAALGKPTVALFGCTDPDVWGPWGVPHRIADGKGSAEQIPVREVVAYVKELCDALAATAATNAAP